MPPKFRFLLVLCCVAMLMRVVWCGDKKEEKYQNVKCYQQNRTMDYWGLRTCEVEDKSKGCYSGIDCAAGSNDGKHDLRNCVEQRLMEKLNVKDPGDFCAEYVTAPPPRGLGCSRCSVCDPIGEGAYCNGGGVAHRHGGCSSVLLLLMAVLLIICSVPAIGLLCTSHV